MNEVGLNLKIKSTGAEEVKKGLDGVAGAGKQAEQGFKQLQTETKNTQSTFAKLTPVVGALVTALAAANLGSKITDVTRRFEGLKVQLEVATGSADNAVKGFNALSAMSKTLPLSVDEITQAFIKMKNLGLEPTADTLTSFANTAAANGKTIMQFTEAVADAVTGEFERLKEFGIKSAVEGDKVAFTFRGMTKTIGNNSKEINAYLKSIGENEFAGAAIKQMDTLEGATSNLGVAFDNLIYSFGQAAGVGDTLKEIYNELSSVFDDISFAISESSTEASNFNNVSSSLGEVVKGVAIGAKGLATGFDQATSALGLLGAAGAAIASGEFGMLPEIWGEYNQKVLESNQSFVKFFDAINKGATADDIGQVKSTIDQLAKSATTLGTVTVAAKKKTSAQLNAIAKEQADSEKQWSADLLAFYQEEQDEKTKIAEVAENLRTNLANDRHDAEVALWDAEAEADKKRADAALKLAEEQAKQANMIYENMFKRLDDGFANMWEDVIDGSGNAFDFIQDAFKKMLAEMAHRAITQPIIMSFMGGTSGATGLVGSASGAMDLLGIGSSIGNMVGGGLGILGTAANYGAAAIGGASMIGGAGSQAAMLAAQTGSFGTAGASLTAGAFGSTAGGALSGLMAAAPWIGGALLLDQLTGGNVMNAISTGIGGGSYELKHQTLKGTATREGFDSQIETVERKDGGWGRKSKTRYKYDEMAAVDAPLSDIVVAMFDQLDADANRLGMDLADNFTATFSRSVKGMSGEQIQAELTKILEDVYKQAVDSVDGLVEFASGFAMEGEEAYQTLTRLLAQFDAVSPIIEFANNTIGELSKSTIEVADNLIALAGSIENLGTITTTYYDLFFSDAEKLERNYGSLTDALRANYVALPTTRDAYRAMVEALDLTTESGQEAYVTLLAVSELADEYYSNLETQGADALNALADAFANFEGQADTLKEQLLTLVDSEALLAYQREKQLSETDDLLKSTQRNVWLLQDAKVAQDNYNSALTTATSYLTGVFKSIRSFTSGLLITSALSASTAFAGQLELARGGDVDALGGITQSAGTYLDMSKSEATSLVDYQRTMVETINSMHDLEKELTPEQFLAQEIKDALILTNEPIEVLAADQLALLDGIWESANLQVDSLGVLNTSVNSLTEVMRIVAGIELEKQEAARVADISQQIMLAQKAYDIKEGEIAGVGSSIAETKAGIASAQTELATGISENDKYLINTKWKSSKNKQRQREALARLAQDQAEDGAARLALGNLQPQLATLTQEQAAKQSELAQISEQIAALNDEIISGQIPQFAVGTNYVNQDMIAQIHKGEMIVPAKFNPMTSGLTNNGNAAMLSELRALRSEISELRQQDRRASFEIVKAQKDTRDIIEQWNFDGMPQVRT